MTACADRNKNPGRTNMWLAQIRTAAAVFTTGRGMVHARTNVAWFMAN